MPGHFLTQLAGTNGLCDKKAMGSGDVWRTFSHQWTPRTHGRLSPSPDKIDGCVLALMCHQRCGWILFHQRSQCSHWVSAHICTYVHCGQLAAPTGRMAFLSLRNHGGSRYGDGWDRMCTCNLLLYLDHKGHCLYSRCSSYDIWSLMFRDLWFIYLFSLQLHIVSLWPDCWLHPFSL